jgi:hypothetical protein
MACSMCVIHLFPSHSSACSMDHVQSDYVDNGRGYVQAPQHRLLLPNAYLSTSSRMYLTGLKHSLTMNSCCGTIPWVDQLHS